MQRSINQSISQAHKSIDPWINWSIYQSSSDQSINHCIPRSINQAMIDW
jgi:hypothetical protein